MPPTEARWLKDWLTDTAEDHGRRLFGPTAEVALGALARASSLDTELGAARAGSRPRATGVAVARKMSDRLTVDAGSTA